MLVVIVASTALTFSGDDGSVGSPSRSGGSASFGLGKLDT